VHPSIEGAKRRRQSEGGGNSRRVEDLGSQA